ncbi:MAG: hypothetical protein LBD30_06440 [Verrucomicrobiales bacterium]|jgi:hypothetical protein|nr:hypothetical protein [Verrucomicrobiales bacterium]
MNRLTVSVWLALTATVFAAVDESPWPNNNRDKNDRIILSEADLRRRADDEEAIRVDEVYAQFRQLPGTLADRRKFIDLPENFQPTRFFLEHHWREFDTGNNVYEPVIRKALTMLCASGQARGLAMVMPCLLSAPNFYDKRVYQSLALYQRVDVQPQLDAYLRKWENYYPLTFKDDEQQAQALKVFSFFYADIKENTPLTPLILDSYRRLKSKYEKNVSGQKFLAALRRNFQFLDKDAFEKDLQAE